MEGVTIYPTVTVDSAEGFLLFDCTCVCQQCDV